MVKSFIFGLALVGRLLLRPAAALKDLEERGRGALVSVVLLAAFAAPWSRRGEFALTVFDLHPRQLTTQRIATMVGIEVAAAVLVALAVGS